MNKTINDYINQIEEKQIKIKLLSSNEMLNNIDNIIIGFNADVLDLDKSSVLLNTFGLLQALFVGVDSLYNMVLSITKNKYYININQNKIMHELKFIRNDVVGHPTNRKYGRHGVGYSKIDTDDLSYENLTYHTYIFRNEDLIESSRTINFSSLIFNYQNEKKIIYDQLEHYIRADYKGVNLSAEIKDLHLVLSIDKINDLKNRFIETYGYYEKHRFMWRLELLKTAYNWKHDNRLIQELIDHIKIVQSYKLYQISRNMENKYVNTPKIKIPKILKQFYSAINKDETLIAHLTNLDDANHPFYDADLKHLKKEIHNKNVIELLNYTESLDNNNKRYLIGSLLKQYRT